MGYDIESSHPSNTVGNSGGGIHEVWAEIGGIRGGGGSFSGESKRNKLEKRRSQVLLEGYVEATTPNDNEDDDLNREKSLTKDDLDELKGCLDLGFGFSYEEIPELCNTLPALELCYSMSQKFLDDKLNLNHQISPPEEEEEDDSPSPPQPPPPSTTTMPVANWKISSPGDNPDEVKARLKYWAQAVACTVRLCS
ncbi:unnamed protein product [Cochlearia groenlandica]